VCGDNDAAGQAHSENAFNAVAAWGENPGTHKFGHFEGFKRQSRVQSRTKKLSSGNQIHRDVAGQVVGLGQHGYCRLSEDLGTHKLGHFDGDIRV
jgi:hypothetical protein